MASQSGLRWCLMGITVDAPCTSVEPKAPVPIPSMKFRLVGSPPTQHKLGLRVCDTLGSHWIDLGDETLAKEVKRERRDLLNGPFQLKGTTALFRNATGGTLFKLEVYTNDSGMSASKATSIVRARRPVVGSSATTYSGPAACRGFSTRYVPARETRTDEVTEYP